MTSIDIRADWPIVMPLVLAIVGIGWLLIARGRQRTTLDLEDLLKGDDGRLSNSKFMHLCSWVMATWLIVYLAVSGQLSEGYFTAYIGAFVAPAVVHAFKGGRNDPKPDPAGGAGNVSG